MKKSKKQEKEIAKKIGGKTHPFSGGLPGWKEVLSLFSDHRDLLLAWTARIIRARYQQSVFL